MMGSISWAQFREWLRYHEMEPWGEERADLRMGITCATLANMWSKKRWQPRDFIPQFDGVQKRQQSPQEIASILTMAAQAAKSAKERKR